ncbi:MAG: AMP-binding protein, partial [Deltaproteobacteria bacterium]|nr:AMP-binding protein [Deltaproteobacteria bacterium]
MQKKLWYDSYAPGVKKALDYEKLTISEALTRTAERFSAHTALNYMGKKITFRQLNAMVNQCARALMDLDVRPGDKVAVCLPNIPQVIIANIAIMRIGAVTVQNN